MALSREGTTSSASFFSSFHSSFRFISLPSCLLYLSSPCEKKSWRKKEQLPLCVCHCARKRDRLSHFERAEGGKGLSSRGLFSPPPTCPGPVPHPFPQDYHYSPPAVRPLLLLLLLRKSSFLPRQRKKERIREGGCLTHLSPPSSSSRGEREECQNGYRLFRPEKRGGRGDKKEKKDKARENGKRVRRRESPACLRCLLLPFPVSSLCVLLSPLTLFTVLYPSPPPLPTDVESNFAESRYAGSGLSRSHETSHASPPQKRGATWSSAVSAETGATTATLPNRSLSSSGHRRNPPLAPGRNNRMHSSTEARCGNGGKEKKLRGDEEGKSKREEGRVGEGRKPLCCIARCSTQLEGTGARKPVKLGGGRGGGVSVWTLVACLSSSLPTPSPDTFSFPFDRVRRNSAHFTLPPPLSGPFIPPHFVANC